MGLIILFACGALLGWVATIVTKVERAARVRVALAIGVVAALAGGIAAARSSLLSGISAHTLLTGVVSAVVALVVWAVVRGYVSNGNLR